MLCDAQRSLTKLGFRLRLYIMKVTRRLELKTKDIKNQMITLTPDRSSPYLAPWALFPPLPAQTDKALWCFGKPVSSGLLLCLNSVETIQAFREFLWFKLPFPVLLPCPDTSWAFCEVFPETQADLSTACVSPLPVFLHSTSTAVVVVQPERLFSGSGTVLKNSRLRDEICRNPYVDKWQSKYYTSQISRTLPIHWCYYPTNS